MIKQLNEKEDSINKKE